MAKNKQRNPERRESEPAPAASNPVPPPPPPPGEPSSLPVFLRWFVSQAVRQAVAMRKHVQKLLNHQRDILSPQAIEAIRSSMRELDDAVQAGKDKAALEKEMEKLEATANKWLKPYPNAAWRENVEVLLVALAVAMGIRTFFLQPFKIPTGSMQPTLFGVTSVPDYTQFGTPVAPPDEEANFTVPSTLWGRVKDWFGGVSYIDVRAKGSGTIRRIDPPFKFLIFNIYQTIQIGDTTQWIWFPPDYGGSTLDRRAGIYLNMDKVYQPGEQVIKMKVTSGDHLFVDRVTYNFRPPERGEIVVFETKGVPRLPPDQFYIKRMVAKGGESVRIGNDRHLVINGKRLDASTPHFEKVYSFNPKLPPRESQYSGHVNAAVGDKFGLSGDQLAPLFPDAEHGTNVPPNSYMVMGDNTVNSFDSRAWGAFPASHVIGKALFVYWPITDRFGVGYHR